MRYPLSWLAEWLPLAAPAAELARRLTARWVRKGSNHAASSTRSVVVSDTSTSWAPMTPAMQTERAPSAIIRCSGLSARTLPSSVVIDSPGRARRTTMRSPWSFVRSKAWSGWPSSSST